MKALHMVTFILLAIGGLNWGVWALTGWDVGQIFGGMESAVSKVVYVLVGLSALYELIMHSKHCKMCKNDSAGQQM
ncbi:MAG: hypothetical protein A3H72_01515 [Candidatus Doudnabacteria bacterium RIFCSPLOWO2_02_FULL_48_8]|uniref:DUF378 domain-containing protein n=1 Tax=Candidatus Doudnabacteria bacterium RIFCSPHIGHO2_01_FULL_46_24 TaxID=1817825 RepID=A0A1F5NSW4_9BACT|nr:MAG: hypothetical protein A2720_04410 [Candidatus Doudnabacteria bacterium RIFCSPHIGHO2_01_FULL_46_24]OGE95292.1 MAG: hypothetical protein A3H72_01515 [Candidatus Doudnabacteria bacterium RIFCSPLOWO2_02_FULL_48_8]OGE96154.1 MAG: hypothetical protein A3E98_03555 [Candidatus Doudnabacteria bacterium RIFCSPHIGHO2_12_FULL_48_11]